MNSSHSHQVIFAGIILLLILFFCLQFVFVLLLFIFIVMLEVDFMKLIDVVVIELGDELRKEVWDVRQGLDESVVCTQIALLHLLLLPSIFEQTHIAAPANRDSSMRSHKYALS